MLAVSILLLKDSPQGVLTTTVHYSRTWLMPSPMQGPKLCHARTFVLMVVTTSLLTLHGNLTLSALTGLQESESSLYLLCYQPHATVQAAAERSVRLGFWPRKACTKHAPAFLGQKTNPLLCLHVLLICTLKSGAMVALSVPPQSVTRASEKHVT